MQFRHLVFTNFGVGIFDTCWLLYRLEIFKNTVFPSLNNQQCKDFTWFIFIHKKSPNIFKLRLSELLSHASINVEIVEVESYESISVIINAIKDSVVTECLITTRIDDDDLIDSEVVSKVKQVYSRKEYIKKDLLITLEDGAEFLPREGIALNKKYKSIALFLTLVSRNKINGGWKSVNEYAHHTILDTLAQQGVSIKHEPMSSASALFLYVKHPLSDSFYSGAKARILNDKDRYALSKEDMARFGMSENEYNNLKLLLSDSPNGMPYKYMEKLNKLRNDIKLEENHNKKQILLAKSDALEKKAARFRSWAKNGRKIRLAIIGSCVTRDLFEHASILKEKYEISFYSARSSVVSYMAPPNQDASLKILEDSFESKRAYYDLTKTHWSELEASRPDVILADFIDERIGLIKHNGTFFTASGPMVNAFNVSGYEYNIMRPWSPEVVNLRKWALDCFLKRLLTITDHVVLHKAAWATETISEGQVESLDGSRWERLIELNNKILSGMFDYAENEFPLLDTIGGEEIGMRSGGDHKWEFSPFHYDASYYKTLARQLEYRMF